MKHVPIADDKCRAGLTIWAFGHHAGLYKGFQAWASELTMWNQGNCNTCWSETNNSLILYFPVTSYSAPPQINAHVFNFTSVCCLIFPLSPLLSSESQAECRSAVGAELPIRNSCVFFFFFPQSEWRSAISAFCLILLVVSLWLLSPLSFPV